MALLVVSAGCSPLSSFSLLSRCNSAAQPPGPGLPRAAPSLVIVTLGRLRVSVISSLFLRAVGFSSPFYVYLYEQATMLYVTHSTRPTARRAIGLRQQGTSSSLGVLFSRSARKQHTQRR